MLINFGLTHILAGLLALVILLIVLWKQKKNFSYLFFFSLFWIYMMGVVSVVVFPVHIPDNTYTSISLQINPVPFDFGACEPLFLCLRIIYENILLTIPFGFGISFISKINSRKIYWLAWVVGLTLEIIQLVVSLVARSSYRIMDINDVLLNAAGVLLGYGMFKAFGWLYSYITDRLEIRHKHIFAYIYDVVKQMQ